MSEGAGPPAGGSGGGAPIGSASSDQGGGVVASQVLQSAGQDVAQYGGYAAIIGDVLQGVGLVVRAASGTPSGTSLANSAQGKILNSIRGSAGKAAQIVGQIETAVKNGVSVVSSPVVQNAATLVKDVAQFIGSSKDKNTLRLGTVISTILGLIEQTNIDLSAVVNRNVAPISAQIGGLTTDIQNVLDHVVSPVLVGIQGTQQTIAGTQRDITAILHGDLQQKVQAAAQLSSDLQGLTTSVKTGLSGLDTLLKGLGLDKIAGAIQQAGEPATLDALSRIVPVSDMENTNAAFQELVKITEAQDCGNFNATFEGIAKLIGRPITKEEFAQLTDPNSDIGKYGFQMGVLILAIQALVTVGIFTEYVIANLEQCIKLVAQEARKGTPIDLLDAPTVIEALRRGIMDPADAREELLRHGLNDSRQRVLLDVTQYLFDPSSIVDLLARGIIDSSEAQTLASQNKMTPEQLNALTELRAAILSAGDALQAWAREEITEADLDLALTRLRVPPETQVILKNLAFRPPNPLQRLILTGRDAAHQLDFLAESFGTPVPDQVLQSYTRAQIEGGQAAQDWLQHWKIPPAEWWAMAVFRGLRTKAEAFAAFEAENIPRELWEDVFGVAQALPPVWLLPDVLASGAMPRDQAVADLEKLGYSTADANVFADYGLRKGKTSKASTAGALQGLSLASAKALFDDGAIDQATYQELLVAHGLGTEAAALTVELAQIELDRAARKSVMALAVSEAEAGITTTQELQTQLYAQGFSTSEVDQALAQVATHAAGKLRIPTEAQLGKLYTKGVISEAEWRSGMSLLGFREPWISRLLELLTPPAQAG